MRKAIWVSQTWPKICSIKYKIVNSHREELLFESLCVKARNLKVCWKRGTEWETYLGYNYQPSGSISFRHHLGLYISRNFLFFCFITQWLTAAFILGLSHKYPDIIDHILKVSKLIIICPVLPSFQILLPPGPCINLKSHNERVCQIGNNNLFMLSCYVQKAGYNARMASNYKSRTGNSHR